MALSYLFFILNLSYITICSPVVNLLELWIAPLRNGSCSLSLKPKTLATMKLAWATRVLLVSLTFIALSLCLEVSIWSGYYKIVKNDTTNWKYGANIPCRAFQGSILNCTVIGYKSSWYIRHGKFLKYTLR